MPKSVLLILFFCILISCEKDTESSGGSDAADAVQADVASPPTAAPEEAPFNYDAFLNDFSEFQEFAPNNSKAPADFSGEYTIVYRDGSQFTLTLSQVSDKVQGSYCGYSATRVDCGVEQQGAPDCPVKGQVFGDSCYVAFKSCYIGTIGSAKLYRKRNDIVWEMMDYPPNEDGGYFSAPGEGLLIKQGNRDATLAYTPDFSGAAGTFVLSSTIPSGPTYVMHDAALFKTAKFEEVLTKLKADTAVMIAGAQADYLFAEEDNLQLFLPYYPVLYRQDTAYIRGENLPLKQFSDGLGTDFLIGMDSSYEALTLKVFSEGVLSNQRTLFRKVRAADYFQKHFVELKFEFEHLDSVQLAGLHFFKCRWTDSGTGGFQGWAYYYWNGAFMKLLSKPYDLKGDMVNHELAFRKGVGSASDTVTYTLTTGTITDESGDYSDEKIRTLYFVSDGGNLIPTEKN